ncbi:MAG: 1-acyl-sn-glycerol-3-phosphate acyltransferase [Rhodobacter sp.]|nr:1-acyl-sn-glycerol-3-phosphate acyltransferase [Rhodobacter sp.]
MGYGVQLLRSVVFNAQMYLMMALMALFFTPLAILSRDWAFRAIHTYCRYVRWSAGWMIGLRSEIRGDVPTDEVLIAAKHQSFFDIILLVSVLPRPKFIMKKELKWAPILGYFAFRIGCIPVDRGKRGAAITKMTEDVAKGRALPGQLIIYPQGTRVAPGATKSYKVGTGVLYEQLQQDCVPVATNVGVFWPRHGFYRKPGLAVVEFLPRIQVGLKKAAFMAKLEPVIEGASVRLMAEAGFEA